MEIKKSVIHEYTYLKLRNAARGNHLSLPEVMKVIKWECANIPRKYQLEFVQELIDLGMLAKINRKKYVILTIKDFRPMFDGHGLPLWH